MATIAKGMITLTNVNDAYSVLISPAVCAIKADYDGTNAIVDDAYCDIVVVRGDVKMPFKITSITTSHQDIQYNLSGTDATKRITITAIPTETLTGSITAVVSTNDDFVATVVFRYSVMRESTMLDWIQDWENNKTVIGDAYLITPKLFIGKKIESEEGLSSLTGVYIGPDSDNGAGIYGYKKGTDVFHINESGAMIGGWEIAQNGIQTTDGKLVISSDGEIVSQQKNQETPAWKLSSDGTASFAEGKVRFGSTGDASFEGKVTASEGAIGQWTITGDGIYSKSTLLSSTGNYIGVRANDEDLPDISPQTHKADIENSGGVYMHYSDSQDYGFVGYLPKDKENNATRKIFSIGSENFIAGWNFDEEVLWMGEKNNTFGEHTTQKNSITIGTSGLRSYQWRLESDGSGALAGGKINWGGDGAINIGNWIIDGGAIKSSNNTSKYVSFDATDLSIELYTDNIEACYPNLDCGDGGGGNGRVMGYKRSSKITLSAQTGFIQTKAISPMDASGLTPTSLISPSGMYAEYAGIIGIENHYASIVGYGQSGKTKKNWCDSYEDEICVVGVYGKATNHYTTDPAPAYGGYFENLKACGLTVSKRVVTDETAVNTRISPNDTLILSLVTGSNTIILPTDNIDGKILVVYQLGEGQIMVKADEDAQHTVCLPNEAAGCLLYQGDSAMFILTAYQDKDNNTIKYVWIVNKFNNS